VLFRSMLMGRRTFDVVRGFGGAWPYGATPMLVATTRPLDVERASVRAVQGTIEAMVAEARRVAGARDVYVDGGTLVRATLAAGLLDELTLTIVPVVLGAGIPLFGGTGRKHLSLESARVIGAGMVQLRYRVAVASTPVAQTRG